MPMHDWTRVDPSDYHTFHLFWITHVSGALNRNRLPDGYYAMADHTTPPIGRRRIAIRHERQSAFVAAIEIISPSDQKKLVFADLVGEFTRMLREGIHLLLVVPFPPPSHSPSGLHAALWEKLTGNRTDLKEARPLMLASYEASGGDEHAAYIQPFAVGDRLADMPLFLRPKHYTTVPLEETYLAAWNGFPLPLRRIVEES